MKYSFINMSRGQVSRVLIILAVVILVAIVVVYFGLRAAQKKNSQNLINQPVSTIPNEPPKPVYETQVGDVDFSLKDSRDLGSVLAADDSTYAGTQQDLTTTERFIKVIVGAQNKGKTNTDPYSWDVGNIIDSEGRNFVTVNNQAYFWLPKRDLCGALLKPEFEPTPCVKMYEVSKLSKGLKIEVKASGNGSSKRETALLDLQIAD